MDHSKLDSTTKYEFENKTESELTLIEFYYSNLESLEQNKIEEVAKALSLKRNQTSPRENERNEFWIQKLISIRISLKKTVATDQLRMLAKEIELPPDFTTAKQQSASQEPNREPLIYLWIIGECLFVQGLIYFHLTEMIKGLKYFAMAAKYFQRENFFNRMALALFNRHVGQFADSEISTAEAELNDLIELEKQLLFCIPQIPNSHISRLISDQERIRKVEAFIYRQKAWCFERLNKMNAAVDELRKATRIFELCGPKSDCHLSLIQMADLLILLDNRLEAMASYERIFGPVDERVQFPLAFLKWRLFQEPLNPKDFNVIIPSWQRRYESRLPDSKETQANSSAFTDKATQLSKMSFWQNDSRTIEIQKNKIQLSKNSLEGRLISILLKGKATKFLLSESLWPELADTKVLDHRLHQLINRIKGKIGARINFDGQFYSLDLES